MGDETLLNNFLKLAVRENSAKPVGNLQLRLKICNLRVYLEGFYRGIPLSQKSVLDIGCGIGLLSIYAFCKGARPVVGLEPEAEGSTVGALDKFLEMINKLGLKEITALPYTFQEYDCENESYDVIALNNSINHLDEQTCIHLQDSQSARDKYIALLTKMNRALRSNGKIIITDRSRYNLFAFLGVKNPLCPSIEWHKHQSPRFWANLLECSGFTKPRISWATPSILRALGKPLGNRAVSYFLCSHFRLVMDKE